MVSTVYLYTTTDSGVNCWRVSGKLVVNQLGNNMAVDFLDAQHWWIYGGGRIYFPLTKKSFVSTSVAITYVANLDFINQSVGFAIVDEILSRAHGETGVYKTTDGGKTWTRS